MAAGREWEGHPGVPLRDQENLGYFLVTWKLEGLVSKERMKTHECGHIQDQITNHLLLYLLLKV